MMDGCTHSMAPGSEKLLRLVLDEELLEKEAREHLEQCSTCQQQLAIYTRAPGHMLSKLYRSTCPNVTHLNFYCAGMLNSDEELAIAYHIAECLLCAEEVATTRQFLADFEPFPSIEKAIVPKKCYYRNKKRG